jgi:hypothetical protein
MIVSEINGLGKDFGRAVLNLVVHSEKDEG